jgi:hypothetical protein
MYRCSQSIFLIVNFILGAITWFDSTPLLLLSPSTHSHNMSVALYELLHVFEGEGVFIFSQLHALYMSTSTHANPVLRTPWGPPTFHIVRCADVMNSRIHLGLPDAALNILFVTRHVRDHPALFASKFFF